MDSDSWDCFESPTLVPGKVRSREVRLSVVPGSSEVTPLAEMPLSSAEILCSSQSLMVSVHFLMFKVSSSTVNWSCGMTSAQDLNSGMANRFMNPVWDFANASILPIIGATASEDGIPNSFSI